MAITKTRKLNKIEIYPTDDTYFLNVLSEVKWDDPEDDELPIIKREEHTIKKQTLVRSEEEGVASYYIDTDYSNEEQLVQDICNLLWSE